ncbi:TAXI family TRAP transporter solute-binding subunit [Microvirga rosea]|uniref:TAXI family TRAP transporter solute-binding subunit n=1 Tax=Microvirga rosea TaxID=2715425 RepID=UPI001D0B29F3|nr:TAXI family TRAP transporter solute-binding subunit [Microvirga rosea]MCB8819538.1 TAXI family TRAP transporter solute-binding subunit [Microvirga rosea]
MSEQVRNFFIQSWKSKHRKSEALRRPSFLLKISRTLLAAAALLSGAAGAYATDTSPTAVTRANAGTIGIISGGADGTYIRIAADLANVLDDENLRVLPIIGRGSLQNLRDIMFLRGVDIGIVQMDAREQLKAENLQNEAVKRLRFITRLYNEEVHILTSRDITDIRQLDGKKVNIDKTGSGTNLTAQIIFAKLGIKPELTTFDQGSSYERLRSGEIQAAVYVAGRPVRAMAEFQADGRFHLLPIPFEGEIAETYFPARLTNADYPRLIDAGKAVDTLAVGSLLAVFNWPESTERYGRVKRFVNAFFSKFDDFLQPGRHPKWKEVNLAADVPGWERMRPAQDWLDQIALAKNGSPDQLKSFEVFLTSKGTSVPAAQREHLFREFLAWQSDRQKAARRTTRQD